MKKVLFVAATITAAVLSSPAQANEKCYELVDPVAVIQCLITTDGAVVTPMGPGSGGTGGGTGTKPPEELNG